MGIANGSRRSEGDVHAVFARQDQRPPAFHNFWKSPFSQLDAHFVGTGRSIADRIESQSRRFTRGT